MRRLMRMGEEIGEDQIEKFEELRIELDAVFSSLRHEAKQEAVSDES